MLDRGFTHKWLGCMLRTANAGNHTLGLAHHLYVASKTFFANRPYLVNRNVAMQDPSGILTPWSLLLLVSVLPTETYTNRKRSTSWPPCLHLGLHDSTVLQAHSTGKLATTCPGHFFLDESIR